MTHTVYSPTLRTVVQTAQALGVSQERLLEAAGIRADSLDEAVGRVPVEDYLRLYRVAAELCEQPSFGLHCGRVTYVTGLNVQLYMSGICNSFKEYLNLMPSVLKLRGDIGEVKVRREGELLRLDWLPLQAGSDAERFLSDEILCSSSMIVNSICVQRIPVLKACFSYPEPEDTSDLEATFKAPLLFDQPYSCIYLHQDCLQYRITKLDAWSRDIALPEHLFAPEDRFLADLRQAIIRLLPSGEMSVDRAAADLGLSRRTLQRRLAQRDTQFVQVLQGVRTELARSYLADKRLGITDIAFLLGYADQASFSNAFKTWYGVSPRDFRQS